MCVEDVRNNLEEQNRMCGSTKGAKYSVLTKKRIQNRTEKRRIASVNITKREAEGKQKGTKKRTKGGIEKRSLMGGKGRRKRTKKQKEKATRRECKGMGKKFSRPQRNFLRGPAAGAEPGRAFFYRQKPSKTVKSGF